MQKSTAHLPLNGLFGHADRDSIAVRSKLLRVLTDLYVQKAVHSSEEETQYVELALGLIDAVDAATRATVGIQLSCYPAAPEAVLRRLNGQAASPATSMAKAAPVAPAAAMPTTEASPAMPTAKQSTPPSQDLAALFFMAGADERRLILTNLGASVHPTAQPPAPASNEMIRQLEAAALSRNTTEFTRLMESALNIGQEVAGRIVRDYSGEPVVVAAKALGMKAAVLHRILLFLNPVVGQSVERVFALAQLYDEMTYAAAARMLAIWRKDGEKRRPVHAPYLYDDERHRARMSPSPARQQDDRHDTTPVRQRFGKR